MIRPRIETRTCKCGCERTFETNDAVFEDRRRAYATEGCRLRVKNKRDRKKSLEHQKTATVSYRRKPKDKSAAA